MKYNTELPVVNFNENGFADKDGWVIVYKIDLRTREYLNVDVERTMEGFSLSESSFIDKPELPTKAGFAVVRSEDGAKWEIVTDNRGKTAYHTENRQPLEIDFIGDLPSDLTLLAPKTEFDKWNGKKWVIDTEEQKVALVAQAEQEKAQRLDEANATIMYLQDAIEVGLDDDDYEAKLKAWKTYRVYLNRIDTSTAPDITWPAKPE
ncbi:tail fiber assembly protein [Providencia rettgeri]